MEYVKDVQEFLTSGNSSKEKLNGLSPAITAESTVGVGVVAAERFLKGHTVKEKYLNAPHNA